MSTYYQISHTTTYDYPALISYGQNAGCLIPRKEANQEVLAWQLKTAPTIVGLTRNRDYFGNEVIYFAIDEPHECLSITSSSIVHINQKEDSLLSNVPWEAVVNKLIEQNSDEDIQARQFCFPSPRIESDAFCADLAKSCFAPGRSIIDASKAYMTLIYKEFSYESNTTNVDTLVSEVVRRRHGVCQDFSHVAISGLRSLGLAAAYVSGYLETIPRAGEKKLRGSDASHAWFSVYVPECGWIDFDPTNNIMPCGQHIVVARGRDFGDVTPLKGVYLGSATPKLSVAVDVNRIPREKALATTGEK